MRESADQSATFYQIFRPIPFTAPSMNDAASAPVVVVGIWGFSNILTHIRGGKNYIFLSMHLHVVIIIISNMMLFENFRQGCAVSVIYTVAQNGISSLVVSSKWRRRRLAWCRSCRDRSSPALPCVVGRVSRDVRRWLQLTSVWLFLIAGTIPKA